MHNPFWPCALLTSYYRSIQVVHLQPRILWIWDRSVIYTQHKWTRLTFFFTGDQPRLYTREYITATTKNCQSTLQHLGSRRNPSQNWPDTTWVAFWKAWLRIVFVSLSVLRTGILNGAVGYKPNGCRHLHHDYTLRCLASACARHLSAVRPGALFSV